jgi:peptide/nickel transport system permease protein
VPAGGFTPFSTDPSAWARSVVLPVAAMAFGGAANIANQVRGTMIDELRKDYVRTLRTRGVPTRSIVIRHALRNAAGPALTVLGLTFINLFGAALFMGLTAFSVALTIGVNLLIDVANGWLNPKARMF